MKKNSKKDIIFISITAFVLGIFLSISWVAVRAVFPSYVSPGDPLSSADWNDLVAQVEANTNNIPPVAQIDFSRCQDYLHCQNSDVHHWTTCNNNYPVMVGLFGKPNNTNSQICNIRCCKFIGQL